MRALRNLLFQFRARNHLLCRILRDQGGQTLVEFAASFSILMAVVFTLIEVCLMFYSYGMICEMAREGSRYASMHGAGCTTPAGASCTASAASLNTYIKQLGYPNLAGGTVTVETTFPDGSQAPGNHARVNISYNFPIRLAFVPQNTWTLTSVSVVTIVQ